MMKSKQAEEIRRAIMEQRNVSRVYRLIDRCERVEQIKAIAELADDVDYDHQLMCDTVAAGMRDPDIERVYADLLRREYRICCDIETDYLRRTDSTMGKAAATGAHTSIGDDAMRASLERYVEDITLASLQSGERQRQRTAAVESAHYDYLDRLFCALLSSYSWSDGIRDYLVETVLSPSVCSDDAAVVVSAVTLAAMNVPDVNKWLALTEIYSRSNVEPVKQRALVGWVLSVPAVSDAVFPEVLQTVQRLCSDVATENEVMELQIQLFHCFNVYADTLEIHNNIMPSLRRNGTSLLRGIEPGANEAETLHNILHPDADEKKMEAIEHKMNRIGEMQKSGSDVYFASFAQMKDFPFFSKMMHWLVPFSTNHPAVAPLMERLSEVKMMRTALDSSPLCDSDKYSFAFIVSSTLSQLPSAVRSAFRDLDADAMSTIAEDVDTPVVMRRRYLQDLFRFIRLSGDGKQLSDPFQHGNTFSLFIDKGVFPLSLSGDMIADVARFFFSQKQYKAVTSLAGAYPAVCSTSHRLVTAAAYNAVGDRTAAQKQYDAVLADHPDNATALRGAADIAIADGDRSRAVALLEHLVALDASDIENRILLATVQMQHGDAPIGELYRLTYEHPDDDRVKRAIAWGHLLRKEAAKAYEIYDALIDGKGRVAKDFLHAGYAKWFLSQAEEAVALFQAYLGTFGGGHDILDDFIGDDALLSLHGIGEAERRIMADIVF